MRHAGSALGAVVIAASCALNIGNPIQAAWAINQSGEAIIVMVEDVDAVRVPSGQQGLVYSAPGHDVRGVWVLDASCATIAQSANERALLLIVIGADRRVSFVQGADLDSLVGINLEVADDCPSPGQ